MPHVVLNGDIQFNQAFQSLEPSIIKHGTAILKTSKKYIDSEGKSFLVEALAIEHHSQTSFLALISKREDGLVVRIYPGSNVEKTEGVKRILAEIAKQLMINFPSLKLGKTNLQELIGT
ncbi:MAG: hypothetical protein NWE78_08300 [Candidatus Bathyarchaeota archaeon]|nr:hypothetical protein [Candidatus Bathyarchaeota archaeon]